MGKWADFRPKTTLFEGFWSKNKPKANRSVFFQTEFFHTPYDRISQGTVRKLPECLLIEGLLGPHGLQNCQIDRRFGHKDVVI